MTFCLIRSVACCTAFLLAGNSVLAKEGEQLRPPSAEHAASRAEEFLSSMDWTGWPKRFVRIEDVKPTSRVQMTIHTRLSDAMPNGTVLMRVHIDETGQTRRVGLLRSSGHANLDEAAMQSAWKVAYSPYVVDGQPQAVTLLLPLSLR